MFILTSTSGSAKSKTNLAVLFVKAAMVLVRPTSLKLVGRLHDDGDRTGCDKKVVVHGSEREQKGERGSHGHKNDRVGKR